MSATISHFGTYRYREPATHPSPTVGRRCSSCGTRARPTPVATTRPSGAAAREPRKAASGSMRPTTAAHTPVAAMTASWLQRTLASPSWSTSYRPEYPFEPEQGPRSPNGCVSAYRMGETNRKMSPAGSGLMQPAVVLVNCSGSGLIFDRCFKGVGFKPHSA